MHPADLDQMFTALADPARRAMVERLCAGRASVSELAAPAGMALPSALKHLRVLEQGGIVISHKRGRVRTFAIDPAAMGHIEAWVDQRKAAINAAFDRLEQAIIDAGEEP